MSLSDHTPWRTSRHVSGNSLVRRPDYWTGTAPADRHRPRSRSSHVRRTRHRRHRGRSAAAGQVTDVVRFTDYPLLAKLSRGGVDAHMGSLFGLPNQIALAALALALIFLILWGYRMWWQRGRAGAFGRPIPRGAWRQVPSYALATLTVAIAVLGYYLPLLGIPLAAFLLIDLALGRLADRSGKRTQTAGT
ncbi:PepSY domain-containing protein [Streptomyces sp. Rer75]|uniref:PepSY domain-containing protein n=1 Tax=Streptomyces sp. Rer75 TaxID=2750011 RepID=UPI0015CFFC56|nr:PepSY domain-containing protein [Streptomyces sp. Rer75]QLH19511.1 PepSY domain-containing protein [Streptomyces sp. Rer75]